MTRRRTLLSGALLLIGALLFVGCYTFDEIDGGPGRIDATIAAGDYCAKPVQLASGDYGTEWRLCVEAVPTATPAVPIAGFRVVDAADTPSRFLPSDDGHYLIVDGETVRTSPGVHSLPECESGQVAIVNSEGGWECAVPAPGTVQPPPFTVYWAVWPRALPNPENAAAYQATLTTVSGSSGSVQTVVTSGLQEATVPFSTDVTENDATAFPACREEAVCGYVVIAYPTAQGEPDLWRNFNFFGWIEQGEITISSTLYTVIRFQSALNAFSDQEFGWRY